MYQDPYSELSDKAVKVGRIELIKLIVNLPHLTKYRIRLPDDSIHVVVFDDERRICSTRSLISLKKRLQLLRMLLDELTKPSRAPMRILTTKMSNRQALTEYYATIAKIRSIKSHGAYSLWKNMFRIEFDQQKFSIYREPTIRMRLKLLFEVWKRVNPEKNNGDNSPSD